MKDMTLEEAQKMLNDEGFAWSVLEVYPGDRFTIIICDWQGESKMIYYSNPQQRIVRISRCNQITEIVF